MLIELLLKRAGGSHIDIGGVDYHFAPESAAADARHVCEVQDEGHAERFLEIKGYCLADASAQADGNSQAPGGAAPLVLKNGDGEVVDLSAMSRKELLKFAAAAGFTVKATLSAADMRAAIAAQTAG